MAPTEGPEFPSIFFFSAVVIIHTVSISRTMTITGTVAIRLPAVDKYHIAGFQIIPFSFIDQFSFPILDHKAKVRLQFLTLAGVGFDRC